MPQQPIKKGGPFQKPRSKTVRKNGKQKQTKKVSEQDGNLNT